MGKAMQISFHLDPDGGGEVHVFVDERSHVDQFKYVFDSLDRTDQIPAEIAEAIRKDGRERGEIPRTDSN